MINVPVDIMNFVSANLYISYCSSNKLIKSIYRVIFICDKRTNILFLQIDIYNLLVTSLQFKL